MPDTSSPNIVVIMSDQHHPGFMGCAGEPFLHTPHLDALAARGTRFSNAYCNFPLCCPSRMSFMTSRYASEIDCLSNHAQLGSDIPTFAHAFNAAGYDTILCGRMHFNGPDQRHGFRKRIVGEVVGTSKDRRAEMNFVLGPVLSRTTGPNANAILTSGAGYSGYQTYDETVSTRAADWIRSRAQAQSLSPFMMVVGFVLPHAPFVATPADYALYKDRITTQDLPRTHQEKLHPALRQLQRNAKLEDAGSVPLEAQRRARTAYYGMCTHLDRVVGRVLDALEESGQADNTLVIYTSDHGEQLGEHGMWWKHTFYEASAGVPLIIAGPGVPRDSVVSSNVSLIDIGPTLLEMAGASAIPAASGQSFRCLLNGRSEEWHDTVIAENLWPPGSPSLHRMLKHGAWKLCHYPGQKTQLFNLDDDPHEETDRAEDPACRDRLETMSRELLANWDYDAIMARRANSRTVEVWTQQWWTQCDLPMPDPPWCDDPPFNHLEMTS